MNNRYEEFTHGGAHPPENKLTRTVAVTTMNLPTKVVILMNQHIGAPAKCIVAKGDSVVVGQLIGEAQGFVSANIHASIAGKVTSIDPVLNGQGVLVPAVTIEREADAEDVWCDEVVRDSSLLNECNLTPEQIIERIKAAGIVGMGGAMFPTHVKLSVPEGKSVDTLVINGAECEPYLTSDHQLMLSRSEELMVGVEILMAALPMDLIEWSRDAITALRKPNKRYKDIKVHSLRQMVHGGEKQLIEAVTGRQASPPPLPIDVNVVAVLSRYWQYTRKVVRLVRVVR